MTHGKQCLSGYNLALNILNAEYVLIFGMLSISDEKPLISNSTLGAYGYVDIVIRQLTVSVHPQ